MESTCNPNFTRLPKLRKWVNGLNYQSERKMRSATFLKLSVLSVLTVIAFLSVLSVICSLSPPKSECRVCTDFTDFNKLRTLACKLAYGRHYFRAPQLPYGPILRILWRTHYYNRLRLLYVDVTDCRDWIDCKNLKDFTY